MDYKDLELFIPDFMLSEIPISFQHLKPITTKHVTQPVVLRNHTALYSFQKGKASNLANTAIQHMWVKRS